MIILNATDKSLEVVLGGAVATNELPIVASFVDVTTTTYVPGATDTESNGATPVTAVAAPAASTQRQVKLLTVFQADTAPVDVTVQYNNNATIRPIVTITMQPGSTLIYTDGEGFRVIDANGSIQQGGGGTPGGLDTQVQFNDGGSFGGDAGLTYDKAADELTAGEFVGGGVGLTDLNASELTSGSVPDLARPNPVEQTTTATGTEDDFDLDGKFTVLRCNNASALEFTGFTVNGAQPVAGDLLLIINVGTSTVQVMSEDAGSAAENQCLTPSAAGQIIGMQGAILFVYDGVTELWRMVNVEPGAAIDIPFDAGDFTAAAGAWTVDMADVLRHAYIQRGKFLTVIFTVSTTTTTMITGAVFVLLKFGFLVANGGVQVLPFGRYFDGAWRSALGGTNPGLNTDKWQLFATDAASFPALTDGLYFQGTTTFEVD